MPSLAGTLNGSDKTRLVKRARKLSQVFGDVAVLEALALPPTRRRSQQLNDPIPTPNHLKIHKQYCVQHDCRRHLPSFPRQSCELPAITQSRCSNILPSVNNRTETHDQCTLAPAQLVEANATKLSRHLGEVVTPELISSIEKGRSYFSSNGTDWKEADLGFPISKNEGMKFLKPQTLTRSLSLGSQIRNHTSYDQSPKDVPSKVRNTRYSSIRRQLKTTKLFEQEISNINYAMPTMICPEFHHPDSLFVHNRESYEQNQSFEHCDFENDVLSIDIETKDAFQDRRRRAAKLSQFFGVNPLDIVSSTSTTRDYSISPERNGNVNRVPSGLIEVEVKISGRRFWGFSNKPNRSQNARMGRVRDQLRSLRAT